MAELWIYCNIGFPPAKDNSVFVFCLTAWETYGLMDIQEGHHPERVVSWWHQGFISMEFLAGSRIYSQPQDTRRWDLGVRDRLAWWAWDRTKSLETWQFSLRLHTPFTLSKQRDEGSRGRDKCHCRLIQIVWWSVLFRTMTQIIRPKSNSLLQVNSLEMWYRSAKSHT